MANDIQLAITTAAEGIAKLEIEMKALNLVIATGAKNLKSMLSTDVTSFKELNKLNKEASIETNKLTEASNKKGVVFDKLKVKQSELIKELKQFDKEVANQAKLKKQSDDSQIASEKNKNSQIKAMFGNRKKQLKQESDLSLKRAKDYESASKIVINASKREELERKRGIKQREAQVEKVSRLDQALRKLKASEDKVSSKAMTGRMVESVNAIGKTNDELKKMSQYYQALEKDQVKQANAIAKENTERKKANKARLAEADSIERNKNFLKKQKDVVIKMSRPYNKLIAQHKQAKKVLQDVTVAQGKNSLQTKKAQTEYDRLSKKVNQANAATRNFAKGGLRSSVINLLGAFGFISGVQLFASAVSSAFQLTTALDSIGFSMRAIIKDSDELAQTQVFLTKITKDYGAELITTTNRYVKFRAAAMQAGMSAKETQDIFGTMTKAAGVLGLKTDELTGIYLALEQMISKGKVTTEELRRQLGERLPGAMDIMATSLGVTTAELDKMLRAGEVITKDVLPAFARQVEISFGLDKVDKVVTLRAAITRLKNSWSILVDDFAKGGTQVKSLTSLLDHFADNFKTYVNIIIAGAKAFLWYKTMVLAANIQTKLFGKESILTALRLKLLNKATITSTKSFVRFNAAMKANIIGLVITAIYLAYEALEYFNKPLGETTNLLKEQTEELKGQVTAYKENTDEVNKMATAYENLVDKGLERTNEETAEMERLFIALAKVAPQVVTDRDEFGVATEIATGKLKEFNKEMKNSLIDRANFNISEQTKELAKYKKVQEDLIKFQKGNFSIAIEDLGYITKKGDAYKKLSSNGVDYIDVTLEEKAAISDYLLKIDEGLKLSKKTIETNEDLIGTITGVLTERQKEAKAKQDGIDADKAEAESIKKNTIWLGEKRKELQKWNNELKELSKGGKNLMTNEQKERFDELTESIKKTNKEIEDFTGVKNKKPKISSEKDFNIEKFRLERSIKLNEEIATNERNSLKDRLDAKKKYGEDLDLLNIEIAIEELAIAEKSIGNESELTEKALADSTDRVSDNAKKVSDLQDKIYKDNEKALKDSIEGKQQELENAKNIELADLTLTEEERKNIENRYNKLSLEAHRDILMKNLAATGLFSEAQIKAYGDMVKKINAELGGIGADDKGDKVPKTEEEKLAEKFEKYKEIFGEVTDSFSDMFDIDISKFDFIFDTLGDKSKELFSIESIEDWAKLSKELIGSVLDASLQSYDVELQEAQRVRDVTLDNDLASAELKEAARKQFDEKERDINTRKAKEERKNNLIKIAVDTAVGVAMAASTYLSNPATAPLFPFVASLIVGTGLAQAALVASQPLPKFEKGTGNAPEGMATTDEKGAEIHTDRLGNIKDLGSNKGARNKYLEKGDKIFTADQSKNMLERFDANHLQSAIFDINMVSNGNILSDKAVDRSLLNEVGGLRKDIDKMGLRIQKMASRPISVNNKVEIKQDRAY